MPASYSGVAGTWWQKLKSAPVDGKANAGLIALVVAQFNCMKLDRIDGT